MKGLKAVAGFVSSNASSQTRLADLAQGQILTLVASVAEARFPVPRLEIIAKFSHLTFQSNIEQVIPVGELLTSETGIVDATKPDSSSYGDPQLR